MVKLHPSSSTEKKTLSKILEAIHAAAQEGAQLICFGETLLPGYPLWIERAEGARFEYHKQKDLYARYVDQAIDLDAGDLADVCKVAEQLKIYVILGIAERDPRRGRSVFATAVSISPEGRIVSAHRKLMPTHEERLTWSPGDAHGLVVHPYQGFRVGVLNCWENWLPLPRATLYMQGETLHVALWPGSGRMTELITRSIAKEGRSYVLSVGSVIRGSDFPDDFPHRSDIVNQGEDEVFQNGGSCVAGPDGAWVIPPADDGQEAILYADLDPRQVDRERQSLDVAGHYGRPDLFDLRVRRTRWKGLTEVAD